MSEKFKDFKRALDTLCREHGVILMPSQYDNLELWDVDSRYPDELGSKIEELIDRTGAHD